MFWVFFFVEMLTKAPKHSLRVFMKICIIVALEIKIFDFLIE